MISITSPYTRWKAGLALFLIIFTAQILLVIPRANAVSLSNVQLRTDRLGATQAGHLRLVFKTPASETGTTALTIDMNGADATTWSGQSGSVHAGTMTKDISTCATEIGGGTLGLPGGSLAVSGASGHTISITSITALAVSTTYCIDLTNSDAVTNPSAGTYHPTVTEVTGGSATSTAAINIVGSTSDQITVNATVNPSFTFTLSSTSAGFASALSASSPSASTAAINSQVSTNAAAGWQMWLADLTGTPGLKSTAAAKTIAYSPSPGSAASTLSNGVEGFNVGAGNHTGTCNGSFSYDTQFDNTAGTPYNGGGLDGTLRSFAKATSYASNCAVPLTFNASISNTTPAANDYTATVTVVAAGNF
jgi:hypothetical protein